MGISNFVGAQYSFIPWIGKNVANYPKISQFHPATARCARCAQTPISSLGGRGVPANSARAGAAPCAPGGARHGGGNRAMTSQPHTRQSTSCGDVKSSFGGQAGGTGVGAHKGHPEAPTHRGRSNTVTQHAGATPGGTNASAADKEEGGSEAGGATRTGGTGNQNVGDGRACAWGAATTQGMAWPASPVATGCQGNPCSTVIRWGVSPAAQMGCLCNRRRSPPGQTSRGGERDMWWTAGTKRGGAGHLGLTHTETQRGRPWTA